MFPGLRCVCKASRSGSASCSFLSSRRVTAVGAAHTHGRGEGAAFTQLGVDVAQDAGGQDSDGEDLGHGLDGDAVMTQQLLDPQCLCENAH